MVFLMVDLQEVVVGRRWLQEVVAVGIDLQEVEVGIIN